LYEAALKDLQTTQTNGSLNDIELCLGNKIKRVNLKIPIMFIIGDNQGGDSICGRTIHYGLSAKRISQMCDAGPTELQSPKIGTCKRIIMQDVMDNVERNNTKYLEDLYQAPHWIAWFDLDYGGNPEGILSAACPPEVLHALENGIFLHILRQFFKKTLIIGFADSLMIMYLHGLTIQSNTIWDLILLKDSLAFCLLMAYSPSPI